MAHTEPDFYDEITFETDSVLEDSTPALPHDLGELIDGTDGSEDPTERYHEQRDPEIVDGFSTI